MNEGAYVTPFDWTRWRLQSAAASFLLILAGNIFELRNFAVSLGEAFVSLALGMRKERAQHPISLRSRQRIP